MTSQKTTSTAKKVVSGELTRRPNHLELEELQMLREVFRHSPGTQHRFSEWWQALRMADRRTLLAFAGIDESEESAARKWPQLLEEHRSEVLSECRRLERLLRPICS